MIDQSVKGSELEVDVVADHKPEAVEIEGIRVKLSVGRTSNQRVSE